ncbi:BACON domain-containing protein [Chloracidobacterium aggregatum]|uniref:BACON domain-containing protein n=1 Tax=Chloracidobacterium aggregatum TaxID=2851959 RepID=UPI001B8AA19C|nr:BACON domain-containing protein [Chloracidobacterium aggregatum]QUV96883.1 BACON domain-containing protein [Chloracidobacterium sp. E]
MNPAGGQMVIATMTRSAVSLCNLTPTITTNSPFVTIVGAVPRSTNPGFVDIVVNLSPNNTGANRPGSVTVTLPSETVTPPELRTIIFEFTQGPDSGCTYTATAVPASFPVAGGTGQFQITTGSGCSWTIPTTSLPTWISASPLSGSGSSTVNFTVAANTGSPRSATVTVAGQNITITQAGTCTLTLGTATGTSLPVTGGTGQFTVTTSSGCTYTATSSAPWLVITGGASGGPTGTVAFSVGRNSGAARQATITVTTQGAPSQTVTVSQAPDSGPDTVGMFRPSNGFFYLRFSNTSGNADTDFFYGTANDVPLSGDWDADGVTTIGIFRNGQFFLRNSNSAGFATVPAFAIDGTQPGDIPIAGDWDGNGSTTVGLFRAGVFLLRNSNTPGPADVIINYALPTDTPIVGDWDGDGVTTIGLYRASVGFFALRNTNTSGAPDLQFFFGNPNDVAVAGDWDGDGVTTIGVFRTGTFFLRNSNSAGPANLTVNYGVPTDRPVIGKWVP